MLSVPASRLRALVADVVRSPAVARGFLATPRVRGRNLTLLWHRVRPSPAAPTEIVPTVTVERFRQQLDALREVVAVVPLSELDRREPDGRPTVALTFDDDDEGHARYALPVLVELGLPATFFLSGRWLHDRGAYWWESLERRVADHGVPAVASRLGVEAATVDELAAALEGSPLTEHLATGTEPDGSPPMSGEAARALVEAGMEIGFHTVDHPALPTLDDAAIDRAVSWGREELGGALATPVERLAFPHGRHDARVRAAVARERYVSGWSSSHAAAHAGDDPRARGRWEPRDRPPGELLLGLFRRLSLR